MTADTLTVRVAGKRAIAEDICCLDLHPVDGRPLPGFEAGAHIDVHLPGRLIRQYSLCNAPQHARHYQIAVLRDPATRGGSRAVHDAVREGDTLVIGRPRNRFALADNAPHHLLLAGGIGVTPLMAMAWALSAREARFEMHYFTRSPARTAFREVIRASSLAAHVRHWFDDDATSARPTVDALLAQAPAGTHVYVCGPGGFIDHVIAACARQGVPAQRVHYERFQSGQAAAEAARAFTVVVGSTGRRVAVTPEESVVEALARAGVPIPVSCEQGICGTCLTGVRAGVPDHRDQYLTDAEHAAGNCFTPCCSRALTPELVLDI
ncbi:MULTISPECIES: PDR/VanB family oxidoreductase [Ralstonia solanacearum species complex]|uniref:PDR/VanB family oxidoreductase n=1 Tax=Ralstonia solanacearum species complex TaxID=3116862 RepID=UPI000E5831C1|nr:PDR/VanB family oxidoreductase [Ralstonia solanacearum]BEU72635.1 PDR/VanB family oxidoreductase [Ralstonia pseudosolanacearum]AXV77480.1 oxidoreductase [Ralstonia solanacearum]AXV91501.1 oxidoreductase [Ralstonia solanacearum]AXW19624.1 oxidoreductase [Ralstonia solanacearum]AXW76396.1 oxidoreductase [Ralstonia solanacearum]